MQPPTFQPGTRITASLELVRPLGAGGMGAVWVAHHHGLGSNVVVKFIAAELAQSAEALARFQREAASAAEVRSPHVVQMLDHGVTHDGVPFIAMELLEGESLRERIDREGGLPPPLVATVIGHCCKALTRAHERGVVHRDIKPDNLFLTDGGDGEVFAKVLDFGIAKSVGANLAMTSTGAALGSPYYMSPEQVLGSKAVDARSDLWSLGVTAYEALTGRRPFEGETVGALSIAICHGTPVPPTRVHPGLPPAVDAWFARACAVDVNARFATARELSDALARALSGGAWAGPPSGSAPLGAPSGAFASAGAPPSLVAALPMTTTGVGAATAGTATVREAPASRSRLLAVLGGVVVLGALGGVAASGLSRGGAASEGASGGASAGGGSGGAAAESASSSAGRPPRPSPSAASSPGEVLDLDEPPAVDAGAAPPAKTVKAATAPTATANAANAANTAKTATAPSASTPATAATPATKPPPKVQHEPNIF
jgi:hypothetical protein